MTKINKLIDFILNSAWSFFGIIVIFVVQSVWLALTAIYPLPFDEYYHIGFTKIYAQQWTPFITSQPVEASIYGDITRTPSYLFHYLMSFHYRLLSLIFDNQEAMIIGLRLINIAIVVLALILFRKLFLRWGISKKLTNFIILIFVCTPIVPFLAAHHSYDNLLLLLTAISLILATNLLDKKNDLLSTIYWLLMTGLAGILVKDQFLPLFGIIFLCTFWLMLRKGRLKNLRLNLKQSLKKLSFVALSAMIASIILLGGLVGERYGKNLLDYRSLQPKCEMIQPVSVCEKFMPWYRNQQNKLNPPNEARYANPASFTQHWVSKIMRGYFAIFSHTPTEVVSIREPFGPIVLKGLLPMPIVVAYAVLVGGVVTVLMSIKVLWKNEYTKLALSVIALYLLVLWVFNYQTYLKLGVAQAIQARYTYPILLLIYLILAKSYSHLLGTRTILKSLLVFGILLTFVWGGGIAGYLIRADATWYWQNETVILVNTRAQDILRHIVIH